MRMTRSSGRKLEASSGGGKAVWRRRIVVLAMES